MAQGDGGGVLGIVLNVMFRILGLTVYVVTLFCEKMFAAFNGWLNSKLKQ